MSDPTPKPSTRAEWQALRRTIRQRCDTAHATCEEWEDSLDTRDLFHAFEWSRNAMQAAARLSVYSGALVTIDAMMNQGNRHIDELRDHYVEAAITAASTVAPNSTSGPANLMRAYLVEAAAELADLLRRGF